jgi:hypothetical protein
MYFYIHSWIISSTVPLSVFLPHGRLRVPSSGAIARPVSKFDQHAAQTSDAVLQSVDLVFLIGDGTLDIRQRLDDGTGLLDVDLNGADGGGEVFDVERREERNRRAGVAVACMGLDGLGCDSMILLTAGLSRGCGFAFGSRRWAGEQTHQQRVKLRNKVEDLRRRERNGRRCRIRHGEVEDDTVNSSGCDAEKSSARQQSELHRQWVRPASCQAYNVETNFNFTPRQAIYEWLPYLPLFILDVSTDVATGTVECFQIQYMYPLSILLHTQSTHN